MHAFAFIQVNQNVPVDLGYWYYYCIIGIIGIGVITVILIP